MFKITSVVALIVGLLLAVPLFLTATEASRGDIGSDMATAPTARADANPIDAAFQVVAACQTQPATCQPANAAPTTTVAQTVTIEERDEANHTSTLIRLPAFTAAAR